MFGYCLDLGQALELEVDCSCMLHPLFSSVGSQVQRLLLSKAVSGSFAWGQNRGQVSESRTNLISSTRVRIEDKFDFFHVGSSWKLRRQW
jgi:hypothetical protein